jgi:AcrR family transcriptional regulator
MASAKAGPSEPATRPRSRKGAATRLRLVNAAKVVFERDGFLEARIVDIAETAQLAPGSFYHYFDSKEQIFREVAQAQEERLTAPADDGSDLVSPEDSPRERIRRANRRYLERYREEAALMGVIEQVSRYDDHVNVARMTTMKHFVERAERAVSRLQREGLVDQRLNPAVAADALGAMVARFAELWLVQAYRDYDFDMAVEQLSILWGNALGLKEPAVNGGAPKPAGKKAAKKKAG